MEGHLKALGVIRSGGKEYFAGEIRLGLEAVWEILAHLTNDRLLRFSQAEL